MPVNRYYVDAPLTQGATVTITDQEARHLLKVVRHATGDPIEIINGKNLLAQAHLTTCDKHSATAHIDAVQEIPPRSPPITLAVPLTQMSKLSLITEKACELGVHHLWIYPAARSEKTTLSPSQTERLNALLISAMKQCGRLDLPTLTQKSPITTWIPFPGTTLFGDTRPTASPLKPSPKPTLIITGPESGFTPDEIAHLVSPLNATGVTLHHNILRMETAPLVALTLLTAT